MDFMDVANTVKRFAPLLGAALAPATGGSSVAVGAGVSGLISLVGSAFGMTDDEVKANPAALSSAIQADPQAQLKLLEIQNNHKEHIEEILLKRDQLELDEKKEHNRFTAEMEGTAGDLKAVPYFGALMIFLRGAQRVVWGYGALWMTFMVVSGTWAFNMTVIGADGKTTLVSDPQKMFLFIMIDLLVLATLFGERAVRNILPIVIDKLLPIFKK